VSAVTLLPQPKQLDMIQPGLQYFDHQIEGIRQMARMNSFLLADEMGLGKTLQALAVTAIDFQRDYAQRVLIVSPATLKWNWQDEIKKHTIFTSHVLDGNPKKRSEQLEAFDEDVLIINYEQVQAHLKELNNLGFDITVFDEAHYIKNHKSKRTKACHALVSSRRFLVTGSPMLNQANDLWSLLHMIDPDEYPRYWSFVNRFCVFGGFKDKQIIGVKNEVELNERLNQVMVRRLKADVLDLPDKQYTQIRVELHPQQRALYNKAKQDLILEIVGQDDAVLENALTKMLRLKQICATTAPFTGEDHSTKLDVAVEKSLEIIASGKPTVIFTQFRDAHASLVERLQAAGLRVHKLTGSTPQRDRKALVDKWSNDEPSVLVAMVQVAGTGLTMTAATTAIFVDKLYVPSLNEQAADRLHRIGTDKNVPVQIIEIIARDTIEDRIEAILANKKKIFGSVVEGGSAWNRILMTELAKET